MTNHEPAPAKFAVWKHPSLKRLLMPILVGVGCVAGYVAFGGRDRTHSRETLPPEPAASGDERGVRVTVASVSFRPIQRSVVAVGTLYGFEEVTISAKTEGRVRRILHDVSERVKPGEPLLEIDPTDADLAVKQAQRVLLTELAKLGLKEPPAADFDAMSVPAVKQAKARLDREQANFARAKRLADSRSLAQEGLDNAIADYRAAEAEFANQQLQVGVVLESIKLKQSALAIAQQQLDDTVIRVPTPTRAVPEAAAGLAYAISQRTVTEGSYVKAGGDAFKAVIDHVLKLRVQVPEHHSGEVALGQKVEVGSAAYVQPFAGTVARINPSVDPSNRTFEVEILVPNGEGKLKPGGFVRAAILTRMDPNAATIPLEALVQFAGITKIFLADGSQAKEVRVSTGVQTTEYVEVVSPPLRAGDQVVTSGQTVLADGSPIVVRSK